MYFIKKISAPLISGFLIFLLLLSCDKIDPPYMTGHDNNNGNNGEDVRKVLLEEFTGHRCPNCPEGSKTAEELSNFYGNRVVIMSIHAGFFAEPSASPFEYDFITEEGNELHDFFSIHLYPSGMINRKSFNGSPSMSPAGWGEAISQVIDTEPGFSLELLLQYDQQNKQLKVDADVLILADSENIYYLSLFLTENNIIKPQSTNNPEYPEGIIEDYRHDHVLRKAINNTWGEQINQIPVFNGDTFSKSYSLYLDDEWIPQNCSVIAFVYNKNTHEIMQVTETQIPG